VEDKELKHLPLHRRFLHSAAECLELTAYILVILFLMTGIVLRSLLPTRQGIPMYRRHSDE
jgi:hypothetical protein